MLRRIRRMTLGLAGAGILAAGLVATGGGHAAAYGKANWQATFSGTGTVPGGGGGFGFWGWCAFAGGVTSGDDADCQFAQYFHAGAGGGGVTCEVSLEISSWNTSPSAVPPFVGVPTFHGTGTASVHPASLTAPCVSIFPGSANFTNADLGIPAKAGHYNLGNFGVPGSFQIQVVQIP